MAPIAPAALVKANGRFIYRTRDGKVLGGYNLLRHCGTAWAIADIANALGDLPGASIAARRAMNRIIKRHLYPMNGGLCVADGKMTKLGGAGLAILALAELHKTFPDRDYLETAEGLATFILSCERDDGDFHHKLRIADGGLESFRSEYYTGEALFGVLGSTS